MWDGRDVVYISISPHCLKLNMFRLVQSRIGREEEVAHKLEMFGLEKDRVAKPQTLIFRSSFNTTQYIKL